MVTDKLAILGASGHGRVIADIANDCGWQQIDFFDDAAPTSSQNYPWSIKGTSKDFWSKANQYQGVIVGIGNNAIRLSLTQKLIAADFPVVTLCHPTAFISQYAKIDKGTVIMPQAAVNIGAEVGIGCIINTSASIDHDCRLDDGVHISPGAHLAGNITVGKQTWVGIGASVKQGLTIGANTVVGAGATVVSDIVSDVTVVGTPAKVLEL